MRLNLTMGIEAVIFENTKKLRLLGNHIIGKYIEDIMYRVNRIEFFSGLDMNFWTSI